MALDVFMPVLDGLRLLDRLDDPPPVVLVTAHSYDEEIMARRDKVFMYIQKPLAPRHLIEAVASALTTSSDERKWPEWDDDVGECPEARLLSS